MDVLQLSSDVEVLHIGPSLEKGRLPSVIYFALSGQESLELDPYNQPALYLAENGIRVFSLNLPAHGPDLNAIDAINVWKRSFEEGNDLLAPFLEKVLFALDTLLHKGLIVREKIGLMGLSRGGLIAGLVAAKYEIRAMVSFAPMTQLPFVGENPKAQAYNLSNSIDVLCEKTIRFYIGNRDTRVSTDACYVLCRKLADAAFEKGLRTPPIEFIMTPSIGHMGHGTSKETFEAGAQWLGKTLGAIR
jgi:dienelactone hydrolase